MIMALPHGTVPKRIWVNGCFDIIHRGHIELLKYAKSLGGYDSVLFVGIDSDEKVKRDKGDRRPFNKLEDRIAVLSTIRPVDFVYSFDSRQGLEDLIKSIHPDIMVVGEEYRTKGVVGSQYAEKVEFFKRIPGHSTTRILEKK